ncbi:MAG: 4-hydroxy-3-methylbut-2-enyl diphosphate reductase [Thermodesulfobacteriota bacterium]
MKLHVAKSAGFCFGVERAMEMALKAARKGSGQLYTLGPLIHNPQAVEHLKSLGIQVRNRVEKIPGGTVIFRSHGVSLEEWRRAKEKRLHIIDATCPIVKRAQFFANYLHRRGYDLLIVGEAHHPEVEAIKSYVDEGVVVDEVKRVRKLGPWKKLGIIAQTTQSVGLFEEIVTACLEKAREVRVFNTICHATMIRQKEALEIAKRVDCMIVVGGYNSGNTQRLAAICREIQPYTYHIETAEEIDPRWLTNRDRIGLTAGASTPAWIIKEVEEEVRRLKRL